MPDAKDFPISIRMGRIVSAVGNVERVTATIAPLRDEMSRLDPENPRRARSPASEYACTILFDHTFDVV